MSRRTDVCCVSAADGRGTRRTSHLLVLCASAAAAWIAAAAPPAQAQQNPAAVAAGAPGTTPSPTDTYDIALRAAQIGQINALPATPQQSNVAKQQAIAVSAAAPNSARPGISGQTAVPQFAFGQTVSGFNEVFKIKFKTPAGLDDFCSGVLLATPATSGVITGAIPILTAGHCSCGRPDSYQAVSGVDDKNAKSFQLMTQPVRYPGFSCLFPPESQIGRDLALLWLRDEQKQPGGLAAAYPFSSEFPLIATMHQVYQDSLTRRLVGVGYGLTETNQVPTGTIGAIIPIQSFFCSSGAFAASACASFREFVLAVPAGPGLNQPDSCGGDSGAPIFWVPPATTNDGAQNLLGHRHVVGITSRGLAGVQNIPGMTCGGGGIYTAVGHPDVIAWLTTQGVYPITAIQAKAAQAKAK
jgi:Trypsin